MLLYALMAKIALPRIDAILAARSKRIGDDMAAAQQLKERSDAAHAAYEKALADARSRAQAIANDDARATGGRGRSDQQAARGATARASWQRPRKSIAATRSAAMGNVGAIAADTASAIVERLIGKAPTPHEVAAALDSAQR